MTNKMDKIKSRMLSKSTNKLEKINSIQKITVVSCQRGMRFEVDGGLIGFIEIINNQDKAAMEVHYLPVRVGSFHATTLLGFKGSYSFDEWIYKDICDGTGKYEWNMIPVTSYSQLYSKSIDYMLSKILKNDGKYVIKSNDHKYKYFRDIYATL